MARANKINLRAFQQELSERLKHKTAAQVDSLRLALECGGVSWLVRLGDTGEVVPCPVPVSVPLTKPWFLGVAIITIGRAARVRGLEDSASEVGRSRGAAYRCVAA